MGVALPVRLTFRSVAAAIAPARVQGTKIRFARGG
jgi:hypothetical protein